ncbi:hypothetical protein EV700_2136 [Fluviicoccus keumensis]|uniref:Uncharacterized protein n=2 Tax=Fluviicoccus keumensis TaxID=1435465 RepID=A0A4Q7Z4S6_9GAMM|nr:hypothetical protein EV700_2136 [Fluviicoccus keumensis]
MRGFPDMAFPTPRFLLSGLCLLVAAGHAAAETPVWTEDFLGLTGTATVFDSPVVRDVLLSGSSPGNLEKLALTAGYRPWAGGRLWLLEAADKQKPVPIEPDAILKPELDRRGLVVERKVPAASLTALYAVMHNLTADRSALTAFLATAQIDGIVVLSRGMPLQWQLILPDLTLSGVIEPAGKKYLPHVWAENMALQWQWPGLRQASLVHIGNINSFTDFKTAETALGTICRSTRLLRIEGDTVSFACQSGPQAAVPERTGNLPLQAVPLIDNGLDDMILMGRQLSDRSAVFRWQGATTP